MSLHTSQLPFDSSSPLPFHVVVGVLFFFSGGGRGKWEEATSDNAFNSWAPIAQAITEYQDPAKADKITAITQELEETKEVLVSYCK